MADVFSASLADIQRAARIQAEIMETVHNGVRQFREDAARSAGWVGRDDAMARELGLRDEREREGTDETATSLLEVIGAMADVLDLHGSIIGDAQDDAYEAIHDSKLGRH
ncbi:hypothetical protein [Streptomyces sp. NPDC002690]